MNILAILTLTGAAFYFRAAIKANIVVKTFEKTLLTVTLFYLESNGAAYCKFFIHTLSLQLL